LTLAGTAPFGERTWLDTAVRLPEGAPDSWRDVLSGERVTNQVSGDGRPELRVSEVLRRFPVALLTNATGG
jgi:maltooligosyltrehalose synthase